MVVQCLAASIAFELLAFVYVRSRLDVATAVYLYLIALVRSLRASLLAWAIFSLIIFDCLPFFLSPAIFFFRVSDPTEGPAIFAFLTTLVAPAQVEGHE
jgi:hypothetical protein